MKRDGPYGGFLHHHLTGYFMSISQLLSGGKSTCLRTVGVVISFLMFTLFAVFFGDSCYYGNTKESPVLTFWGVDPETVFTPENKAGGNNWGGIWQYVGVFALLQILFLYATDPGMLAHEQGTLQEEEEERITEVLMSYRTNGSSKKNTNKSRSKGLL